MKKLIENLKKRLDDWMQNRYGMDEFSILLLCVSVVLLSGSVLLRKTAAYPLVSLFACVPGGWAIIRCLSRNISGRRRENDTYLKLKEEIAYQVSLRKKTRDIRKSYRYFTCKDCKCRYRVPRGQGKIQITCPSCGKKTIRRT